MAATKPNGSLIIDRTRTFVFPAKPVVRTFDGLDRMIAGNGSIRYSTRFHGVEGGDRRPSQACNRSSRRYQQAGNFLGAPASVIAIIFFYCSRKCA